MTRRYHFVIMFDEETKQWDFDIDNEEVAFNSGTIYNKETKEWEFGYEGDGVYNDTDRKLAEQLTTQLEKWNSLLKTGETE
jgi:hypothetical protein